MRFYSHFSLAMDRSPGFGCTSCYETPSSDSLSLRLRTSKYLTMQHNVTRRSVLQKVRGRTSIVLPLLVNTGFQVLFHSPPGVLFTFPSRYYALSVTILYLGLGGGPPGFPPDFSCPAVLWYRLAGFGFRLRGCHPLWRRFPTRFHYPLPMLLAGPQPQRACSLVWPASLSLAATQEIDVSFSSSGYLDVSVPRVPFNGTMYSFRDGWTLLQPGFPIRTSASQCLLTARRGFSQLATSFFGVWCQGIHPVLFLRLVL